MTTRKLLLVAAGGIVVLATAGFFVVDFARGVGTSRGYSPQQPIAFSHELHAGEREIPCMYCHYAAEQSRHAGIPALSLCMGCHREIDKPSLDLARLADAVERNRPVRWIQIHKLPDFVYFSHRQHVGAGVECQSCHGPVETMEVARQEASLTMGWCLDCHQERRVTEFSVDPRAELATRERPGPLPARGGMDCAKCHY